MELLKFSDIAEAAATKVGRTRRLHESAVSIKALLLCSHVVQGPHRLYWTLLILPARSQQGIQRPKLSVIGIVFVAIQVCPGVSRVRALRLYRVELSDGERITILGYGLHRLIVIILFVVVESVVGHSDHR